MNTLDDTLPIIFEDETLLVVDKPPGLAVTTARSDRSSATLVDAVQAMRDATVINAHRIDDEVGGLVIFAKTKPALDFISGQFQSKTAERVYRGFSVLAAAGEETARVTELPVERDAAGGLPDTFTVDYALAPDQHVAGRMHVYRKRGGRPAHTRFNVVERFGRFVWLEARPLTSREMQVQAHLAAVGAPVLGDRAHGLPEVQLKLSAFKRGYKGRDSEKPMIDRVALHLTELTVKHPATREPVTFSAPLPTDFEVALRNLRKYARRR
ncbi:RluA family pseudouridine synthase [Synoicihabitans lomoniglobus]|uniref:Pseudouridine synthase n=1 Tax=Synoicihabitans lomoniglobus TaxID=2909285 RepID=A0AAE9ZVQ0_9BACT|nr:RluA family pseudouridine synthase [Opitutaceae bacterium LMO-M01]WED63959.1 pseudouridine synthase [Opitutaceae bacterium LMO-M01]